MGESFYISAVTQAEIASCEITLFVVLVWSLAMRQLKCIFSSVSSKRFSRFSFPVTVHREQSVKREKSQQDATIRCLLLASASTCFGHHYAHLQENKDRVTAFGVLYIVLASYNAAPHNRYQPHPAEPEQYTKCSNTVFVLLKMGIMMPETC
jgi:hypothetical protein